MKGNDRRAKKQPVEKSVTGNVRWETSQGFTFPVGLDVGFDWDDIVGKTGIFTFSWTD